MTLDPTPPNPWPAGSPERAEHDAIAARLRDPTRERRALRLVQDQTGGDDVTGRARSLMPGHVEALATSGVLLGPDCSQFQGAVDWSAVANYGSRIFGYKVSEGRTYQDPQHQRSKGLVRALQAAGRGVGLAYHYLFYGAEYASNPALWAAQADWYCSLVDPGAVHALDVEDAAPAPGLGVDRWVARYFQHFPSKTLTVYSNHGMWTVRSHVTGGAPAGRVETWHAGYRDGLYTPARGSLTTEWAATGGLSDSMRQLGFPPARLWQFTDHAAVPGVAGTCDGNAFLGTLADLRALATGAVTDDMSAEDVTAITKDLHAYIDQALHGARDDFAAAAKSALLGANLGSSGPTVGVALQSGYQLAQKIQGQTDTLEASEAALQAGVDALNAKLGSGGGGQLTKADLLEALGAVRLTTDPQQPTA